MSERDEGLSSSNASRAATGPTARIAPEAEPSAPMRRVDFEKDGYHVDDVAISGKLIEMFRLERMGREDFWAAIYFSDGTDLTFSIYGRSLSVAAEFGGEPIAKATPPPTSHVKEGS